MNQYIVMKTQQIAVEAEDSDEALRAVLDGKGVAGNASYNIQIRPPQPQQPGVRPNAPANPTPNP